VASHFRIARHSGRTAVCSYGAKDTCGEVAAPQCAATRTKEPPALTEPPRRSRLCPAVLSTCGGCGESSVLNHTKKQLILTALRKAAGSYPDASPLPRHPPQVSAPPGPQPQPEIGPAAAKSIVIPLPSASLFCVKRGPTSSTHRSGWAPPMRIKGWRPPPRQRALEVPDQKMAKRMGHLPSEPNWSF
jgi:hypothetical protein